MFNKNDPLIDSVKKVMEQNNKERAAVKAVNEKFGIQDRKALPREKQGDWDAAYAKVISEGVEALDEGKKEYTVYKMDKENTVQNIGSSTASRRQAMKLASGGEKGSGAVVTTKKNGKVVKVRSSKSKLVKEEDSTKSKRLQAILKRRFGKGDGKESVEQSRREDK